ncbi:phage terminase small subunit [Streptosporangium vulgare]|uniref:phage terminase small subunit n=1 Tax=Streptosporangium vulgare TaxID=46190 RepID=UPI00406C600C
MPRGGARVVSGPPPDPNALRRDRPADKSGWTTLPCEGRPGDPPEWPLLEPEGREWELWADLWAKPQALMWERMGQLYEVAMCVRMLARAEQPRSSIELQKVVRQYFDSLGLSTQGMLRNRWKLTDGPQAAAVKAEKAPARRSARSRLTVIPGDGASD